MATKEIKNLALASEHKKGEYNINNNKGSGFYSYMYIVTENIGEFHLSYINKKGTLDIRTDGYPWEFLMTEKEYKLSPEQEDFVKKNKKNIMELVTSVKQ